MVEVKPPETATLEKATVSPQNAVSAAYLMVNPFAGAAAMSALGMGLASQAFGFWAGVFSGVAKVSAPAKAPVVAEPEAERAASVKARTAAKVLIEETQSAALEIAGSVAPPMAASPMVEADAHAELLPEDFRKPKAIAKPKKPDDLKAISGIGPKLEIVLNGLGVWTHAQIAVWSPEEIAWVDDYLAFHGRIGRDGWIAQAAALAGRKNGARSAS